ncbi:hypothetical protein [Rhizobium sp. LjRoot258]|uniref:hypothetical protein n=1 Tax=Rhizobium sp. LjRoot258 TaxID=3342299 RepID=UPI003ECC8BA3
MQLKGLPLMRPFGLLVDLVYLLGCVVCGSGLCPTCWSRLRFIERPYCGKALLRATLLRIKRTRPQVGLRAKACEENVRDVFAIGKERDSDVLGKRLVLVGSQGGAQGGGDLTVLTFARALSETI